MCGMLRHARMLGTRKPSVRLLALGAALASTGCITETHVVSGLELRRAVHELRAEGHADVVERGGDHFTVAIDESTADDHAVRELIAGCPDDYALRWRPGARPGAEPGCPLRIDRSLMFERTNLTASILYGVLPSVLLGASVACSVGCDGTLQDVATVAVAVVGVTLLAAVSVFMFIFGL